MEATACGLICLSHELATSAETHITGKRKRHAAIFAIINFDDCNIMR